MCNITVRVSDKVPALWPLKPMPTSSFTENMKQQTYPPPPPIFIFHFHKSPAVDFFVQHIRAQ